MRSFSLDGQRGAAVMVAAILTFVVSACGADSQGPSGSPEGSPGGTDGVPGTTVEEVTAAAQEEGRVVFYTADGNDAALTGLTRAFEEKYGIALVSFKSTNNPILERFLADSTRGEVPDVLLLSTPLDMRGLIEDGYMAEWDISSIDEYPEDIVVDAPFAYPYSSYPFAIAFNTDVIGSDDTSQFATFDDVFSADLQGKFGIPDPNVVGGAFNATWAMRQALGDEGWTEFQENLAALEPRLFPSNLPLADAVAAGEIAAGWTWDAISATPIAAGAPMAIAYPEPTASSYGLVGVVADAPHPNAARLFVDWFMSAEAQQLWTDAYRSTSTNTTVEPSSTLLEQEWYRPPTDVVYARTSPTEEDRAAHLDEFNRIVLGE